ncbi:hypothetical protein BH10BAC1_BH10BAC1_11400 [soil metagenome]
MAERNYYILLEVKNTASSDEIKSAYRILAKKYHPDKNIGNKASEEYFKEIQNAYAILSNPEKRRVYDLKFAYTSRVQSQQRSSSSGPQYNGNAYQYAQQQAQAKQQAFARQQQQPESEKKDSGESWQVLVSVGIALVLLYFIISYSTEKTIPPTAESQSTENVEKVTIPEPTIGNFESPYTAFFGEELSDFESKNSINILNSDASEVVVCLIENTAPNRVIRNQYMATGTEFKMNTIPDGEYFLRVYYGSDWNPKRAFLNNSIKGGFNIEKGFVSLNSGKDALKMKREKKGTGFSYSTYEIKLDPTAKENIQSISEEEFFKK